MVSVISPSYINSEWCIKELQEFYRTAEQKQGISVENKSRIFKVLKTPVERKEHPQELQGMTGYEFFLLNKENQKATEFTLESSATVEKFKEKLNDLAYDIQRLLDNIKDLQKDKQKQSNGGPSIYLAETSSDLSEERDIIKRELTSQGYTVLPDTELPIRSADKFKDKVLIDLQQCKLSIHMIGTHYGLIPEGETRSLVYLQNELAAGSMNGHTLTRLIWMPVGLQGKESRQQEFIDMLHNDSEVQKGADLLETPLEELKSIILDKMQSSDKRADEKTDNQENHKSIYIICSQEDYEATRPLEDHLYNQGFDVILPIFEGDEAAIFEEHRASLVDCDAVIIFYGNASELWVRAKMRDLKKAPGYGRKNSMLAQTVYCTVPETPQKKRFRTHETIVITNFQEFSSETLKPFLDKF